MGASLWYLSRATGVASVVLLTAVVVLGALVSGRRRPHGELSRCNADAGEPAKAGLRNRRGRRFARRPLRRSAHVRRGMAGFRSAPHANESAGWT